MANSSGGPYDMYAGQDATRSLATFSMKPKVEGADPDDLSDLEERHWDNLYRWEKLFAGSRLYTVYTYTFCRPMPHV